VSGTGGRPAPAASAAWEPGDGGAYIGLDLGTSGLKGVALAGSGAIAGRGSAGYGTLSPVPGAREQEPRDWLAALESVAGQLSRSVPPRYWRVIGLSGMIPTLVTAGPDGRPTGPAITWQDSRADDRGHEYRETYGADALYRLTGQWVDGRYLLPMFGELAAADPARGAATAWLLSAKDYMFRWLTGETATDPSTASGFGCYELGTGRWNDKAAAAAGTRLSALPDVLPSTSCRPLRAELAGRLGCGQIPICLGGADSVLGALGLGIREPGQVAYIAGTSNVILGVTDRLVLDPQHRFLVTPLAQEGRWGLEMDLLSTGSAIRWLAGLLGTDLDEAGLVALAARTAPDKAPVMMPYLSPGEQGALWDPRLRGAIVGLDLSHGREHLARGLVNGIVLESRRCLAVLEETGGFGQALEVAGGSAADPAFRADLADASRRPVAMPRDDGTDYSARGAALIAALAVDGDWPSGAFPIAGDIAEPDSARAQQWDLRWAEYESARQAVAVHDHARR
jgi:sugar (pentulose or hexulose) kinase